MSFCVIFLGIFGRGIETTQAERICKKECDGVRKLLLLVIVLVLFSGCGGGVINKDTNLEPINVSVGLRETSIKKYYLNQYDFKTTVLNTGKGTNYLIEIYGKPVNVINPQYQFINNYGPIFIQKEELHTHDLRIDAGGSYFGWKIILLAIENGTMKQFDQIEIQAN